MLNKLPSVGASLEKIATLVDLLAFRAEETPEQAAFLFKGQVCTFRALWKNAGYFAAYLTRQGIRRGDRVVLVLPNSEEFFYAFYGAQRAGVIPVPIFPGSGPERIFSIAKLCGARALVVFSEADETQLDEIEAGAAQRKILACTVLDAEDETGEADTVEFPVIRADDIAFIQYTSGSTGNPKGVQLSHRNLLANVRQMIETVGITRQEVFVNWLPVYHDLGLIVMSMCPFYLGASLILLTTDLNVRRWLEALTRYKGTVTAAPDMGYRLCNRNIKNPGEYDLSSLRLAINAAEPVRARTIQEFEAKFGLKSIVKPGYGLAEASVGVTLWNVDQPVKVDARGFVSVGKPLNEVEIRILKEGRSVPAGEIGQIVVRSPAATLGYFNNPEETARLLDAEGYLHTGDLGYLDQNGDLFIVGRVKDIIISSGRTISPQEVEEVVDYLPGVRCSAAVGIDRDSSDGEQVYIFAEVRLDEANIAQEGAEIVREIVKGINSHLGFRPGRVYLIKPHTIPMTHNGKVQHVALRESYLSGRLVESQRILYPSY